MIMTTTVAQRSMDYLPRISSESMFPQSPPSRLESHPVNVPTALLRALHNLIYCLCLFIFDFT